MNQTNSVQHHELCRKIKAVQKRPLLKIASLKGYVNDGDKCFIEQKTPFYYAVAGYYYFLGAREGNVVAKERLSDILRTPELLDYFITNDLVLDELLDKQQEHLQ